MKILDTIKEYTEWIFDYLDSKISLLIKTRLTPLLFQVVSFSLIAFIAIVIAGYIFQSCGFSKAVMDGIYAVCTAGVIAYLIKILMPNIEIIHSVWMKILYVAINLAVVFIAGVLASFLVQLAIVLAVAYFILSVLASGSSSSGSSGCRRRRSGGSGRQRTPRKPLQGGGDSQADKDKYNKLRSIENDINRAESEVRSRESDLRSAESDLNSAENTLDGHRNTCYPDEFTDRNIREAESNVSRCRSKVSSAESRLRDAERKLSDLESQYRHVESYG
ncbi:MAG: hypothetical protein SNI49_07590 [Rikenellaceae bacterium]